MSKASPGQGEAGADHSAQADNWIVAPGNPCPHAPACRRLIAEASAPETADCRVCGQTLDRAELAWMLAGRL